MNNFPKSVMKYIRLVLTVGLMATGGSFMSAEGVEIRVNQGESLQNALNIAMPGDTIVLEAGATFVGDFILPAKAGSSFITVRSEPRDGVLPDPGQRTGPQYAPFLAKLRAQSGPVLLTADRAHHWRFENVEFLPNPNRGMPIVVLGALDNHQTSVDLLPHDIIFDRIYMHDDEGGSKRGIQMNSRSTQVVNSYISGIRREGQESQGLSAWNGTGPFLIENNYIEAAGIGVLFGGADPDIPGLIGSDITVRGNIITKQMSWRGQNWTVKNAFELKNAQRVTIDRNIFENSWAHAQVGYLVLFTGLNDGGRCTWCTVKDVTFTNNIVRHANGGLQIAGRNAYGFQLGPASTNLLVRNNLFYDISMAYGGMGRFAAISAEYANVTIDHNTVEADGPVSIMLASWVEGTGYQQLPGLTITNNLMRGNEYGVRGDNSGSGIRALTDYARAGHTFLNNVMASDSTPEAGGSYPASTLFQRLSAFEGNFVDKSTMNYRLTASSPFKNAATDGTDIGVDMDALMGTPSSTAAPPTPPSNVRIVQ